MCLEPCGCCPVFLLLRVVRHAAILANSNLLLGAVKSKCLCWWRYINHGTIPINHGTIPISRRKRRSILGMWYMMLKIWTVQVILPLQRGDKQFYKLCGKTSWKRSIFHEISCLCLLCLLLASDMHNKLIESDRIYFKHAKEQLRACSSRTGFEMGFPVLHRD